MTISITLVTATAGGLFGQPAQIAQKGGQGWLRVRVATMTGDAAYPSGATGGYPVTASTFQLYNQIVGMQLLASSGTQVAEPQFDYGSNVVRYYFKSAATSLSEVSSGTDLSAVQWRVLVWGN